MTLAQACAQLALVKAVNPNAQLYGNDSNPVGSSVFAIALGGQTIAGLYPNSCP
jgi:hypothetical protein